MLAGVYTQIGNLVARTNGTQIGGLFSKVSASLVLNTAEADWSKTRYKHFVPRIVADRSWDSLVAAVRYVDDTIMVSKTFCTECLKGFLPYLYPVSFDIACEGESLDWLDMCLRLNAGTRPFITYSLRPPMLLPDWAATAMYYRQYLCSKVARLEPLDLMDLPLQVAAAEVAHEVTNANLGRSRLRSLFHSICGTRTTREWVAMRQAIERLL